MIWNERNNWKCYSLVMISCSLLHSHLCLDSQEIGWGFYSHIETWFNDVVMGH